MTILDKIMVISLFGLIICAGCVAVWGMFEYTELGRAILKKVKLIRCKDCIYFHHDSTGCWCGRHSSAYGFALDVCENDFCAWAERKEE